MLKQRVITALVLVPLILLAIYFLDGSRFALLTGFIIVGIGGYEWSRLAGFVQLPQRLLFAFIIFFIGFAIYHLNDYVFPIVMAAALIWWMAAIALMAMYDPDSRFYKRYPWILVIAAIVILVAGWWYLIKLHAMSPHWLLYAILLVVVADTSAYFAGKRFGKRKLAVTISPGKTFEGVYGAMFGAVAFSILGIMIFQIPVHYWVYFILLSIITVTISIVGDLFISMMKREAGVKDSGTILPGHGGILDRVDSHLAALPIFTTGLAWSGLQVLAN